MEDTLPIDWCIGGGLGAALELVLLYIQKPSACYLRIEAGRLLLS